jgi:hypothetical protein
MFAQSDLSRAEGPSSEERQRQIDENAFAGWGRAKLRMSLSVWYMPILLATKTDRSLPDRFAPVWFSI